MSDTIHIPMPVVIGYVAGLVGVCLLILLWPREGKRKGRRVVVRRYRIGPVVIEVGRYVQDEPKGKP